MLFINKRVSYHPGMGLSIKLLGDRVAVKRIKAEEKSPGGILYPETAKDKPTEGQVLAVGPGRVTQAGSFIETTVKTGERVLFGKYSGTEIKIDGEDVVVMREEDILAVLG